MAHIMVDLETLGKTAGCKIISIGAVEFDNTRLGEEFYIEIERASQDKLFEDPDTLAWWEKQDAVVRDRLFTPSADHVPIADALTVFSEWIAFVSDKDPVLWGNGAAFDNVILAAAYDAYGIKRPWEFWNDRCYRTMKASYPRIPLGKRTGNLHNALDDAKTQADHLIEILARAGVQV